MDLVELESELELSEPRGDSGENIFSLFIVTNLIHIIISVRYMVLIGISFMLKTKPGKPTTTNHWPVQNQWFMLKLKLMK